MSRDLKALTTFVLASIAVVLSHWVYVIAANIYDAYFSGFLSSFFVDEICITIGIVFSLWTSVFLVVLPFWVLIKKLIWKISSQHSRAANAWDEVVKEIRGK